VSLRRINEPIPASVRAGVDGTPASVTWTGRGMRAARRGGAVEEVLDRWSIDDLWWTDAPVRRDCFELLLAGGTVAVVTRDLTTEEWHVQR
jgi:hypothetical protein